MLKKCMGVINLDENEDMIQELTRNRLLASIPIAGRYRVIDFILSSLSNAGVENVGIFSKMQCRSLTDHIGDGRPWDLNRRVEGIRVFNFSTLEPRVDDVYSFANNIEYFERSAQEYLLLTSSYMVCNIDFNEVMDFHKRSGNDITIVYKHVDDAQDNFFLCETLDIDEDGRVEGVGRNIGKDNEADICMEMYLMKKTIFIDLLTECVTSGRFRKIKNAIYSSLDRYKVRAFEYKGYLRCINSLQAYYKASMEMLNPRIYKQLFLDERPIYTKTTTEVPAKYLEGNAVKNSIIGNGSIIEGTVKNSILFRKVHIGKGAVVNNCIIFQGATIGDGCKLTNIIADKYVDIEPGKELKGDKDMPFVVAKKRELVREV
ncbi:MAG: glucose-phosphate adenylyltransferase [Clostridiales bacterium]|nr:glucose-phosphate adenylyltransferase [Clostridiales bacterium]